MGGVMYAPYPDANASHPTEYMSHQPNMAPEHPHAASIARQLGQSAGDAPRRASQPRWREQPDSDYVTYSGPHEETAPGGFMPGGLGGGRHLSATAQPSNPFTYSSPKQRPQVQPRPTPRLESQREDPKAAETNYASFQDPRASFQDPRASFQDPRASFQDPRASQHSPRPLSPTPRPHSPRRDPRASVQTTPQTGDAFMQKQVYVADPQNNLVAVPEEKAMRDGGTDICWRIVDHLFLGGALAAKDLQQMHKLGITHILNLVGQGVYDLPWMGGRGKSYFPDQFKYQIIDTADQEHQDLISLFRITSPFIEEGIRQGGVLVHCFAGVSRSSTIVAGYLMETMGLSANDAISLIKRSRREANPNPGFMKQLHQFEKHIQKVRREQGPHVSPTALRDVKRSTGFNPFSFNLFGNSSRRSIQPPSNMPAGPPPGHATVGSFSLRPDYGPEPMFSTSTAGSLIRPPMPFDDRHHQMAPPPPGGRSPPSLIAPTPFIGASPPPVPTWPLAFGDSMLPPQDYHPAMSFGSTSSRGGPSLIPSRGGPSFIPSRGGPSLIRR